MAGAAAALSIPDLGRRLDDLGFVGADRQLGLHAARVALDSADLTAAVEDSADRLRGGIGNFPGDGDGDADPWTGYQPADDPLGVGVVPLLALVATADDLAAFHRRREVPAAITRQTLTELGQQVWVHRRTFDEFGLHTYDWMPVIWSGSLYWLGRLQFNLMRLDGEWLWSTHIPQTGALEPGSVDDSFRRAAAFFPRYFGDRAVRDFWCESWLLDPELAAALPAGSNISRFQRRWQLCGEPRPGDEDALFFTFARRGAVDLDALPRDTRLQRVIIDRLRSGDHWQVRQGRIAVAG
jgi:hypothetical protein